MGSALGGAFGGMFGGGGGGGDDAAKASIRASEIQAESQREALNYLKEREALPQQYRDQALSELAGIFDIGDDPAGQAKFFDSLRDSPIYSAIMSSRGAGEEAILRNASATGGLRSGNTNAALAKYNTDLQNQALLTSYNNQVSGLQGLAGLPSLAPNIAAATSGIGQTLAQGQVAAAQAKQAGSQNDMNNMFGLANLGLQAYSAFSDSRLKSNVKMIGKVGSFNKYSWDWNEIANSMGLFGSSEGVMADEIESARPDLVTVVNGFKAVNYGGL